LTTTLSLSLPAPAHRFATTVVAGTIPGAVTLVGGGDPLLTRMPSEVAGEAQPLPELASLAELARLTASRLRADGIRAISLSYDDSLFSGPAVSPAWEPTYVTESIVSPISALWVDEGRADSEQSLRVGAPATFAAERFAALLDSRGIRVRAAPVFSRADPRALELARVESPPLEQIVEHIIAVSDNEAAEVLLRHVGLAAGFAGSFTGGVRGLLDTVTSLGIDVSGADVYDGSGLSRRTLVPVDVLVDVLNKSAERDNPQLRAMVAALPVAGFSGSLASRFLANAPVGLGVVRAKTGTLTGVHGLAGLVTTRGGSVLVFAAVADRVPVVKTLAARAQLERIAAALSTCAC
ncbi:MAG: D-alanyl-D-alanine carboxypeptidase/D-alanyl-D-alanine endopeptidase, partial [Nocardioidaceae bacterium]